MVAEAVNLRVQILKIYGGHGLVHQKRHIGTPGKAQKGRAFADPVMISGDDHHPGPRDRGKQVIDLLQIPGQRLAGEQISRDQKKIRTAVPGILNDGLEGEADGLLSLFPPGPVAVRHHPPVDVCSVNKFHG